MTVCPRDHVFQLWGGVSRAREARVRQHLTPTSCYCLCFHVAQLWFRYLIERQIVPLTGTSNVKHMQEDIDCVNVRLPQSVCDQLDASLPTS